MLEKIFLKNFKILRGAELSLERLTVIVGGTSTGKTSFLESIECMGQLWQKHNCEESKYKRAFPANIAKNYNNYYSKQSSNNNHSDSNSLIKPNNYKINSSYITSLNPNGKSLKLGISGSCKSGTYNLSFEFPIESIENKQSCFQTSNINYKISGLWNEVFFENTIPKDLLKILPFIQWKHRYSIAPPDCTNSRSHNGCSNITTLSIPHLLMDQSLNQLKHLQKEHFDIFLKIQQSFQEIFPEFRKFEVDYAPHSHNSECVMNGSHKKGSFVIPTLYFETKNGHKLPSHAVSEGILWILLHLSTIFYPHNKERIILIDNIEHGLHPKVAGALIEVLRSALNENPKLQIIATTRSPYIVDHINPNEAWLLGIREEGYAFPARVMDLPDYNQIRSNLE